MTDTDMGVYICEEMKRLPTRGSLFNLSKLMLQPSEADVSINLFPILFKAIANIFSSSSVNAIEPFIFLYNQVRSLPKNSFAIYDKETTSCISSSSS
jgi:hypothetical protein